jgi:hypothetical protein
MFQPFQTFKPPSLSSPVPPSCISPARGGEKRRGSAVKEVLNGLNVWNGLNGWNARSAG